MIKVHNLAKCKYNSLGMYMDYHGIDDEKMETYKTEVSDLEVLTEICKI